MPFASTNNSVDASSTMSKVKRVEHSMNYSYFGFSGKRARAASLYSRRQGATQEEVNAFMCKLTDQEGFYNMLDQANRWGHRVVTWEDPVRGKVFKLVYNPHHRAKRAVAPPEDWRTLNKCDAPPGAEIGEYRREHK